MPNAKAVITPNSNSKKTYRVTFLISKMSIGGAERELATLANAWSRRGWGIQIITIDERSGAQSQFKLESNIEYIPLDMPAVSAKWPPKTKTLGVVLHLRKLIAKFRPDVVMGFMLGANVMAVKATARTKIPSIATEHLDPNHRLQDPNWLPVAKKCYASATALVCHSARNIEFFSPEIQAHAYTIPSVLDPDSLPMDLPHTCGVDGIRRLIGVGRLVPQKSFDRLIQAFSKISGDNPDWILEIWGDGPDRQSLSELIINLGLQDKAFLRGITKSTYEVMKRSDLMAMSSRYEGFPLALCEGLAMGLPIVSFDCPTGPREIIRDRVDGILVPDGDLDAFASAIDSLMKDDRERNRLAKNGPDILNRVGIEVVTGMWVDLFEEVIAKK